MYIHHIYTHTHEFVFLFLKLSVRIFKDSAFVVKHKNVNIREKTYY